MKVSEDHAASSFVDILFILELSVCDPLLVCVESVCVRVVVVFQVTAFTFKFLCLAEFTLRGWLVTPERVCLDYMPHKGVREVAAYLRRSAC